jgi:hypothetical protein
MAEEISMYLLSGLLGAALLNCLPLMFWIASRLADVLTTYVGLRLLGGDNANFDSGLSTP